jgi:hypothetical protein
MPTVKLKRLPARYAAVLFPLLLTVFMTAVVSFIATVKTAGLTPNIGALWLGAWGVSFTIAFPTLLLVQPLVRWIVAILVEQVTPQG